MNNHQPFAVQLDHINAICNAVMGNGRPMSPIVKKTREGPGFNVFELDHPSERELDHPPKRDESRNSQKVGR